jgi:hypothetical protein
MGAKKARLAFSQRLRQAMREVGKAVGIRTERAPRLPLRTRRALLAGSGEPGRALPRAAEELAEAEARIVASMRRMHPEWRTFYLRQAEALAAELARHSAKE